MKSLFKLPEWPNYNSNGLLPASSSIFLKSLVKSYHIRNYKLLLCGDFGAMSVAHNFLAVLQSYTLRKFS
jgi:hypothetical protein